MVHLSKSSQTCLSHSARDSSTLTHNVHGISPPYSHFKSALWEVMYNIWGREWTDNPTCRLSKNFLPKPCKRKSKEILKLSRSQMRCLIEIITGQNNLNYRYVQSKIDPTISELCRFCEEEEETFEHLLNECPCFNSNRREILGNKLIIKSLDRKPQTLLEFSRIPAIEEALRTHR